MSRSEQAIDTRGRILALLCSEDRTIRALARELGISANGVRGQLSLLAADGLVTYRVVRRGVGKPAHEYRLTPAGAVRLSRAYLPLLSGLLTAVLERHGPDGEEGLLREVGRALARREVPAGGAAAERAAAAVELLGALGAVCSLLEDGGTFVIQGACCPLRALVPDHPLTCKAVETMLEEYTGMPVREQCEKHDPPSCRLVIEPAQVRGRHA